MALERLRQLRDKALLFLSPEHSATRARVERQRDSRPPTGTATGEAATVEAKPSPSSSEGPDTEADKSDADALNKLAQWVAGGFVLASGLLTYLGVKDDRLTRILRNEPRGALFVFVALGLGVVGGVVAPAISAAVKTRMGLVAAVIGAVLVLAPRWLPTIDGDSSILKGLLSLVIGGLLVFLVAALLFPIEMSLKIATIAVSLIFFGLGMYGAVKLSVEATAAKDRPHVSAAIKVSDAGLPVLTVTTKAAGVRTDEHIEVLVWGYGTRTTNHTVDADPCQDPTTCLFLRGERIGADDKGAVDDTFDITLSAGDFARIRIRAYLCTALDDTGTGGSSAQPLETDPCIRNTNKTGYVDMRLPAAPDRPALGFVWSDITTAGATLTLTPTVGGVGGDGYVIVQLFAPNPDASYRQMARFEVAPSIKGEGTNSFAAFIPRDSMSICATATLIATSATTQPSACISGPNTVMLELPVPPPADP